MSAGRDVKRDVHTSELSADAVDLGPYRHYMQKEIHEQPRAIADTIEALVDNAAFGPELFNDRDGAVLGDIESVQILACGTSYYAGLTARYWIEALAGIPCAVDIASEYRYRRVVADPKQLVVTISQSGETLDTMEALKYAKSLGQQKTLAICNVPESAIPRASRLVSVPMGISSTSAASL